MENERRAGRVLAGLRLGAVYVVLSVLFLSGLFLSAVVGRVSISLREVASAIACGILGRTPEPPHFTIVWDIRLPRALLAALAGAALSASGTAMQSFFQNPMADPYLVGVSAGGALGAVTAIALGVSVSGSAFSGAPVCAFIGALGVTWLVYLLSRRGGRLPVGTFLLTGIATGSLVTAITSFIVLTHQESTRVVLFWLMGSLSAARWVDVAGVLPYFVVGLALLVWHLRDLDALLLGEVSAQHLGINVQRSRAWLLAGSSLMTAAVVAATGLIGFVGLVVPHLMRLLVGPRHSRLLPAAVLAGGTLVVCADLIGRTIWPTEVPIGIVTTFLGVPFFLFLLAREGKQRAL